ncbi:hypothetical protein A3860_19720 [Niastella vici]|uniref:TPM domain-containing protein n=1 Tax=Niastella vici TaxID=1703345 RepID=A0A1V9G0P9_9BACT|nr:hypothetical protein A3860_19720 [Niastella vici]
MPVPHHAVNDFGRFLSLEEKTSLELELNEYNNRTGNAIVFISVDSLTDPKTKKQYTIEKTANLYFNKWGIGDSIKNNGVLLLVSRKERGVRIEVGRGLEQVLTNPVCKQIIEDKLVPNFKKGNFYQGIMEAVKAIEQNLDEPPAAAELPATGTYSLQEEPASSETEDASMGGAIAAVAAVGVGIIALIFIWAAKQARRFGGWFTGAGFQSNRRGFFNNSYNNGRFFSSRGNSGWSSNDNTVSSYPDSSDSNWSSNDNSVASFSSPSFDPPPSPSSSSDSFSGGSSDGGGASGSW